MVPTGVHVGLRTYRRHSNTHTDVHTRIHTGSHTHYPTKLLGEGDRWLGSVTDLRVVLSV